MEIIQDSPFHNVSRLGEDNCYLSQRNLQNVRKGNYLLENHYLNDQTMKNTIDLATRQPNMFYGGYHEIGLGGHNISANNDLKLSKYQYVARMKPGLNKRMFKAVPYLGKGKVDTDVETKMRFGDVTLYDDRFKDLVELNSHTVEDHPFLESVKDTMANPANYLNDDMVRGGVPSRDFMRENVYKNVNDIRK